MVLHDDRDEREALWEELPVDEAWASAPAGCDEGFLADGALSAPSLAFDYSDEDEEEEDGFDDDDDEEEDGFDDDDEEEEDDFDEEEDEFDDDYDDDFEEDDD